MHIRLIQSFLVGAVALFALLVAFNNIVDYQSNFNFVVHVLTMDTTFPDNALMSRAITADWAHHGAYCIIIGFEFATGLLCATGCVRMLSASGSSKAAFRESKTLASWGLATGILLWFTGFMTVGAEWFLMWQSEQWNGQQPGFRFVMILFAVLIFLHQSEPD
ncbi:MAG: DUF2165 family protein [Pseudomonadales bacterium]